jgi:chemotaxis protein MotA
MDPASIIGVVLGFGAIFASLIMEGGDPASIMLIPSIILVLGGSLGAAMAGGMLKDTLGIGNAFKTAFLAKKTDDTAMIEVVVKLADRARREGLLALEEEIKNVDDDFLKRGLQLAVDGMDSDELREMLESEIDAKRRRDKSGAKLFADMGGFAPTIGIIGTVLGLVHVLQNLSDPGELGGLIASAFVATLWGVMTANVLWLPLGNRLKRLSEVGCESMQVAVEGVLAIQAGANPRNVGQKLRAMVGVTEPEKKAA